MYKQYTKKEIIEECGWIENKEEFTKYCGELKNAVIESKDSAYELWIYGRKLTRLACRFGAGCISTFAEMIAIWLKEDGVEVVVSLEQYRSLEERDFWHTCIYLYNGADSVAYSLNKSLDSTEAYRILDQFDTSKGGRITKEANEMACQMRSKNGFTVVDIINTK